MRLPYVYELTDTVTGKWYVGSRTGEKCHPEELGVRYFTSSNAVAPMFEANPERFVKKIIVTSDDIDYVVRAEASILTYRDAKNDENSYNMHNGDGKMNVVKAGAISGKLVGKRFFETKTGMFAPSLVGKGGRVGGKVVFEKKLGCFARSKEKHKSDSSRIGKLTRDNKTGIHGMSKEWFSEHNTKNGLNTYLNKKGVHARTKEQMVLDANKANSVTWKCNVCGLETIAIALGRHQKCSGHTGKIRVDQLRSNKHG